MPRPTASTTGARRPSHEDHQELRRLTYAHNLNRVLGGSDARYVLLLNTDMYFNADEHCLAKDGPFHGRPSGAGMKHLPDISAGRHVRSTGATLSHRRRDRRATLGAEAVSARSLADYFYEDRDRSGTFACDWISGCFMLVRRDAMRDVGRFDEGYVKYFEDVDMCPHGAGRLAGHVQWPDPLLSPRAAREPQDTLPRCLVARPGLSPLALQVGPDFALRETLRRRRRDALAHDQLSAHAARCTAACRALRSLRLPANSHRGVARYLADVDRPLSWPSAFVRPLPPAIKPCLRA